MEKLTQILKDNGIAIICFLSIFVIAYILHLFGVVESFQQFVVVLASAAATYIIVCVTMNTQSKHQLEMQQELAKKQSELQKALMENDDNVKCNFEIYNAKLKVYSDFVSKMYGILSDNKIEKDEMLDLRTNIFGQISFYATGDILKSINEKLATVKNYTDVEPMQKVFADISSILQKDLRADWPINVNNAYALWGTFNKLLDKVDSEEQITENDVAVIPEVTNNETRSENMPPCINKNFWHFTMWSADEQLQALRNGIYELNLVEYNEDWRTNQLKRVGKDDLVFLFRSGGWGYMGVFRVKGWRVFEFDGEGNNIKETLTVFGEPQVEITDKAQCEKDRQRSDIYGSKDDGATLCSSIIVEPLAFSRKGIGNPGGVYRRTISSYDREYGMKLLARFMAIIDDPNLYNVHYDGETTVKMGCNRELFEKILASGNIQPAQRDEKGAWL